MSLYDGTYPSSSVSVTPPLEDTGGVVSIPKSDASTDGYLSKEDFATFSTAAGGGISSLSGDVTTTTAVGGVAPAIVKGINSVLLSGLGTGILKNTTATGVPSIAVAADFPTLNQNTTGTAAGFTGPLVGDVTGTQGATVVSFVGGSSSANVASATTLALAATDLNTASAIVKRDASGNFTAGVITADLTGTATTAVNFTGSLSGNVTGTQGATVIANNAVTYAKFQTVAASSLVGNATGSTATMTAISLGTSMAFSGSSLNTVQAITTASTPTFSSLKLSSGASSGLVWSCTASDGSGSWQAASGGSGITALTGDVTATGPGSAAATVAFVGGTAASTIAAGAALANAATSNNTTSAIVRRDSSGVFNTAAIVLNTVSLTSSNTPYSASSSDCYIFVDTTGTPFTRRINLPNTPTLGRAFYVGDTGGGSTDFPITVSTAGGTAKFSSATLTSYEINQDSSGWWFIGDGTNYNVVSGYVGEGNSGDLLIMGVRPQFGNATTGVFTFANTSDATSTITGSIITTGGLGVAKNIYSGANIVIQGTTDASSSSTGSLKTAGGLGVTKNIYSGANVVVQGTTDSTTSLTGSLITAGGLGVAKNANVGVNLKVSGSTDSGSTTSGSFQCLGGIGVLKNIYAGGDVNIGGTVYSTAAAILGITDATSSTTGTLTTAGGMGVAKKLYVGTGLYLPTTGGTATELNYYESTTITPSWIINGSTLSGTPTLTIVRIGNLVMINFSGVSLGSTTQTNQSLNSSTGTLPSRFRPLSDRYCYFNSYINGISSSHASLKISTAGTFTIYMGGGSNPQANWTLSSQQPGWFEQTICYALT